MTGNELYEEYCNEYPLIMGYREVSYESWLQRQVLELRENVVNKNCNMPRVNNLLCGSFEPDGELQIIHKNGQPYGIRDKGGYLLFFPKVSKYTGQEQRYIKEIQECYSLADKIVKALKQ